MDITDYQAGLQWGDTLARMHGRAAAQDADQALASWMAYARQLERKLASANLQQMQFKCLSEANIAVAQELRQSLMAVSPDDPMASSAAATLMRDNLFKRLVEQKGYRVVDPQTKEIAPR